MKRLISSLLSTAALFYVAMIYRSNSMLYLAVWVLLLLFLLLVYHVATAGKLRVTLNTPSHFVEQDEQAPICIRVRNRSLLPTGKVLVYLKMEYVLSGVTEKICLSCMPSGRRWKQNNGEVQLDSAYTPLYIGGLRLHIVKVVKYDYFGILGFSIRKKYLDVDEQVAVLPARREMGIDIESGRTVRYHDRETDMAVFGEDNPPEISDIRQYRAGDRLRSIHWKLSAKQDELMVYEFSTEKPPVVVLFLESLQPKGKIKKNRKEKKAHRFLWKARKRKKRKQKRGNSLSLIENYITFLYSVSAELLENGFGHYIAFYDSERQCASRKVISSEEKLYEFIGKIQDDMLINGIPLQQLQEEYRDKYQQTAGDTELVLRQDLSCVCEGEVLAAWEERGENT